MKPKIDLGKVELERISTKTVAPYKQKGVVTCGHIYLPKAWVGMKVIVVLDSD